MDRQQTKAENLPKLIYPDLPIMAKKQEIKEAILAHPVIIVGGETGSGKTTQLPKIALEAGLGIRGMIGHTQPRRLAARTIAMRIAKELECVLGHEVGFEVRFSKKCNPLTYIKVMTDGILLNETYFNPWLGQYDCLIIDEAHERSLNIDFLLGYLKTLLQKRKDLKVIITSATLDLEKFSRFFNQAPIIEVTGRGYPVEINYLSEEISEQEDPVSKISDCVAKVLSQGPGDILVFQSGEKEIREVVEELGKQFSNVILLPLFARQTVSEQQKIFQTFNQRKIIVTTNVAESAITVPNIRFVIDSGFARISRYNYRSKLQRLPIEPVSQASCSQRAGRCGRVGPGICYRLYTKEDYLQRPAFTEPEILRTHLAGVILKMLSLGVKEIEAFPFIDSPDTRYIKDGFSLLQRLSAVDQNKNITKIGRTLALLPLEPKLGRMIIAANQYGALNEILIIVSALSIIDPRERPVTSTAQADESHAKFAHEDSDFLTFLNLWNFIYERKKKLSHTQFRKLCYQNYLSYLRICEWFDVHSQLRLSAKECGFRENQIKADFSAIHKSILTGILDGIGVKEDKKEYLGARGIKFYIHPNSILFKKSPSWLMSCERVHTSKTYARNNAKIDVKWIEEIAAPLLKKQYVEPYFSVSEQSVVAFERATLFGLDIYNKRKVNYEKVSPKIAHEIFIQQGLIEAQINTRCTFYEKNQKTIQALMNLENRIRRKQQLLDEGLITRFYAEHLSASISSTKALEAYLKDKDENFLGFSQSDISLSEIAEDLMQAYPSSLKYNNETFLLEYKFDLQASDDGITLNVPLHALGNLKDQDFSWLIPGFLEEKIIYTLKALPKSLRNSLLPLMQHVAQAKQWLLKNKGTFEESLLQYVQHVTGLTLSLEVWKNVNLPAHLKMHFKVIDNENEAHYGDNLTLLYELLKNKILQSNVASHVLERHHIVAWDFSSLPEKVTIKKHQLEFTCYPALTDEKESVSIQLFESLHEAWEKHKFGLARIYLLQLPEAIKNFKKNISPTDKKQINKNYVDFGTFEMLIDEILCSAALHLFVKECYTRTQEDFIKNLRNQKNQFLISAISVLKNVNEILTQRMLVLTALQKIEKASYEPSVLDINKQLKSLFSLHFIKETPLRWLQRYPVYLKAILMRLDKLPREVNHDLMLQKEVNSVQKAYLSKVSDDPSGAFRWRIEEFRISLFAQSLGTIEPVSKVRLLKALENL